MELQRARESFGELQRAQASSGELRRAPGSCGGSSGEPVERLYEELVGCRRLVIRPLEGDITACAACQTSALWAVGG
eukprot:14254857-Alexandrium_andersonii.AAC.1